MNFFETKSNKTKTNGSLKRKEKQPKGHHTDHYDLRYRHAPPSNDLFAQLLRDHEKLYIQGRSLPAPTKKNGANDIDILADMVFKDHLRKQAKQVK